MGDDADRYEAWYTEKLWTLLPAIYRAEDGDPAPRARCGSWWRASATRRRSCGAASTACGRTSRSRACDDWVIDYIGDLLATNLVASLDARGRRVDVGKTIYYRRRKGTVGILEELAADVTGWSVRVVELFRRLGTHAARPGSGDRAARRRPARRREAAAARKVWSGRARIRGRAASPTCATSTARGSRARRSTSPSTRPTCGAGAARPAGTTSRASAFSRGGLRSIGVAGVTAVRDINCANQYTFDPTGRDVPLFAPRRSIRSATTGCRRASTRCPGRSPADCSLVAFDDLYGPRSLSVSRYVGGPARRLRARPARPRSRGIRASDGRRASSSTRRAAGSMQPRGGHRGATGRFSSTTTMASRRRSARARTSAGPAVSTTTRRRRASPDRRGRRARRRGSAPSRHRHGNARRLATYRSRRRHRHQRPHGARERTSSARSSGRPRASGRSRAPATRC